MKKAFLYYFFFTLACLPAYAGNGKIDSLTNELKLTKEDTTRAAILDKLSRLLYIKGSYQLADSDARLALALAQKNNYGQEVVRAFDNIGSIFYLKGDYTAALENYSKGLEVARRINDKMGIASTYGNMGLIYTNQGKYPQALNTYLQALQIFEELGNKLYECIAYGNIGNIYQALGNDKSALENQQKSLDIAIQLNNKLSMGKAYINMGNIYFNESKYAQARQSYEQGLKVDEEIGAKYGMGIAYTNIGLIYEREGNYTDALKNEVQALSIARAMGNNYIKGTAYEDIGIINTKQGQYVMASKYLDSALVIANEIGEKEMLRDIFNTRATIDSAAGQYQEAYADYKNYVIYQDSLKNEENTRKLVQEQMQYDFDKKQTEEKAVQDRKDALAKADKRRQQIITASVSVGLLLVLAFSGMLLSRFRVTQRQKQIIEEQKTVVDEKNKDILDSITYARRLQDAILPPLSEIEKALPESFVLYKPKDIVAGDFYWLAYPQPFPAWEDSIGDGTVLIAAADCTGHGVPGAMVSVVCSNALNRAVKEFGLTTPGKILDKTREIVIETFEKSEGDIKDGMDISLASLTPSEDGMVVSWAGAYNSLWYITNGELKEIQADKQPIGKTDNPKPFTSHTITISRNGGLLYLFTDGYADQFGGPKGKKFKYKQMQEQLLAMSALPLKKQKEKLTDILTNWQGGLEQVDDILVIGIKV